MKIILDTNVFISGIFFSGPPSQILQAWKNKKLQIILSQDILDEYHRVAESLSSICVCSNKLLIFEFKSRWSGVLDNRA